MYLYESMTQNVCEMIYFANKLFVVVLTYYLYIDSHLYMFYFDFLNFSTLLLA